MRINNNVTAMNSHRQYTINVSSVAKSTEKLSSGYRVNRAGDDAAGLAISEKMRAQIRGLTMASKNSSDAISLVQTAEGALQESHNILQRMRELAVQSSSDTNETSIDRAALNAEFKQLIQELDDTARTARFNDMGVIDGSYAQTIKTLGASTSLTTGVTASVAAATVGTYSIAGTLTAAVDGSSTEAVAPDKLLFASGSYSGVLTFQAYDAVGAGLNGVKLEVTAAELVNASGTDIRLTVKVGGATHTAVADMSGIAGNVEFKFDGLGVLTFTKDAAVASASEATGQAARMLGASEAFANGEDEIITPGKDAYITLTASTGGVDESVDVYAGDSYAKFASGVVLSFEKLGGLDALAGSITGHKLESNTVHVDAKAGSALTIQTGSNQYDELTINIDRMDSETLGVKATNIATRATASKAITEVNDALNRVSTQRAALGALQNRLNHKISNLDTSAENLTAAESRIRDLDMAKEMTNYTKNNILVQASTAMLAQANSTPQSVLQLLQ
jgi:flagellin